jgi:predicted HTH domain antitoxin
MEQPLTLEISPTTVRAGEKAIRQAIALQLYDRQIFSLGQSLRLAQVSLWGFQELLGQNKIPRHYNGTDLSADLETIQAGFERS